MGQETFLWGVATAAYQVEGGLNGPGEPENNWAAWERAGRVERCGEALGFWRRPAELLDRAAALGCNSFRLSVEWARLEPSPGAWDSAAADRYAEILEEARRRGLEPVVTLHHFTHPSWCGPDLWLDSASPARFEAFVRRVVWELGRRLGSPVRWWITVNEPAVVPTLTYLLGVFPGTARGLGAAARAYDHLIAAHVRAYDAVHDVYEAEGWSPPMVSVNPVSTTAVAVDAELVDLLAARERGVRPSEAGRYVAACRRRARRRVAAVRRGGADAVVLEVALDRLLRRVAPRPGGAAWEALWASPRPRKLDYLSFDYYDPVVGRRALRPRPGAAALRRRRMVPELWEQEGTADGLAVFLRQAHLQAPDRPILVAENGMCTPGPRPRPDGLRRDELLRSMCAEVERARSEGVPVAGYLHWTIADNYEWGSYQPRFGLHGVDRSGGVRILDTDATGVDAAAAYRDIIAADRRRGSGA